jgi:hypothetical protein
VGTNWGRKHAKTDQIWPIYVCFRLVCPDYVNLLSSKVLEAKISAEGRTRTGTLDNQRGILSPLFLQNSTVFFLNPLSAQLNTDNIDNWQDAKIPCFPELVDFSVSYWQLMLYRKTRKLFPEDFKSFESTNSATP